MPVSLPEPAFSLCCPRMELRQLRHFVALAETGNISRAAEKLFLTQPALSRQIKALEVEIRPVPSGAARAIDPDLPAGEMLLRDLRRIRSDQSLIIEGCFSQIGTNSRAKNLFFSAGAESLTRPPTSRHTPGLSSGAT